MKAGFRATQRTRGMVVAAALTLAASACESPSNFDGGTGMGGSLKDGSVPAQYVSWINKAGSICPQVKPPLLAAQLYHESKFNEKARSGVGAMGIGQFMPDSWPAYAVDANGNGKASPWEAPDAIMAQGKFMCELAGQASAALASHKVSGDITQLMLAGYNAGWGAVLKARGVPAFPETQKYVQIIPKTAIAAYGGVNASSVSAGGAPAGVSGKAKPILAAANSAVGLPYVWGGGTPTSPSGRDRVDGRGPGYDCSGLTRMATYVGSGGKVMLPRTAAQQQSYTASWRVPVDVNSLKPGDLLFWGSPATHVAIYWGNGKIVEAQQSTTNLKVGPIWGHPVNAARPPWVK